MNWLRKSLLLASVGCLGSTSALAQMAVPGPNDAGVVLCRPRPLVEPLPTARAPRRQAGIPAFVVRGQMEEGSERLLPSADELVEPRVKPATQNVPDGAKPLTLVAAQQPSDPPAPDGSKTFYPPAPRPALTQYNPWSGAIEGVPAGAAPAVLTEPINGPSGALAAPGFYARAEYLSWWTKGYRLPVLVTTGAPTTPENLRGTLGQPDTVVLYGGNTINQGPASGARFMFGFNFDPCSPCGIEGGYFFLGRQNNNFFADSSQYPVLARPFFNVNTGMNDRELTASPGLLPGDAFMLRGSIRVTNFSDLQGGELNARSLLCNDCKYTVYGFAGFRYLDLREGLSITEDVVSAAAVPGFTIFTPGNRLTVNDMFNTRNQFYGGQAGLDGELRQGRWFVGGRVQLGLGVTHQTININGSQTVTTLAGVQQTFVGGLLALPSNSGNFAQNRFSVVPQLGLKVGYNVTDNLRLFVGYDFLYWSSVVRPGDQVDTNLNVAQIPNFTAPGGAFAPPSAAVRPIVPFATSSYFAHGVSAGLEWRY